MSRAGRIARAVATLTVAFASGGCFQTQLRSGQTPGATPDGYDGKWHHGYVLGAVEGSGPHSLDRVCPDGWAEVEVETNPFQSLLFVATWSVYSPQDVSVTCAVPQGSGPPPADL